MGDTEQDQKIMKEKVLPIKTTRPPLSKKKRKHKPNDFPKRPLSAYNIFFKETREHILTMRESKGQSHGDYADCADYQSMVKEISLKWKNLEPKERERVEFLAQEDFNRYKKEVQAYEEQMVIRCRKEREESSLQRKNETGDTTSTPVSASETEEAMLVERSITTERNQQQQTRNHHAADRIPSSNNARVSQGIRSGQIPDFSEKHPSHQRGEPSSELVNLLAEEVRITELTRNLQARQLQLARSIQASIPQSQILLSLEAKRQSLGMSPLVSAAERNGAISHQSSGRVETSYSLMNNLVQSSDSSSSQHHSDIFHSVYYGNGGNSAFLPSQQPSTTPENCFSALSPEEQQYILFGRSQERLVHQEDPLLANHLNLHPPEILLLSRQNALLDQMAAQRGLSVTDRNALIEDLVNARSPPNIGMNTSSSTPARFLGGC